MSEDAALGRWIDKLEIREVIERSVRAIDDQDGAAFADLFEDDGVMQLAGTVFAGRPALRDMFRGAGGGPKWTEPGELLKQPGAMHLTTNPIIDVAGDAATAETDMITLRRDADGRAKITLLARYRDRLRRAGDGRWLIASRTGVSIAIPGEEGTDAEWTRALATMPADVRARFRMDG
ncbi:MAG TPA: nuclear transport factor 2 family protein [Acidimicrobiia bacterium]|nr:nuclear transport factor 2 family protein [Acidimicrobiia bacterium]